MSCIPYPPEAGLDEGSRRILESLPPPNGEGPSASFTPADADPGRWGHPDDRSAS